MLAIGILEVGAHETKPETTGVAEETTKLSISPQLTCRPCVVLDDPPAQVFGAFVDRVYVDKARRKEWVARR